MLLLILALGALATLSVLGCAAPPPSAFSEAHLQADGVHVTVDLSNIDAVQIEGHTLADGGEVVLPIERFHLGVNELPIVGKGLEGATVYLELEPQRLLELSCSGGGSGRVSLEGKGSGVLSSLSATGCGVTGGSVRAKLIAKNGASVLVDGVEQGEGLSLDARAGLWAVPLVPFKVGPEMRSAQEHELPVVVRHSSGAEWTGTLRYSSGGADLMAGFVEGLPETAQGMPPGDAVALRWQNGWRFAGEGTVGQVNRFARVVEESAPRSLARCSYQTQSGAQVDIDTVAVDQTVVVIDRQGEELGRKAFKAQTLGYRCSDIQYGGGGDVRLVADPEAILTWAAGL